MNVVTAGQLINEKGRKVWHITPSQSAFEALQMMDDKNVGALLVMDGEEIVGIFSERDYARKVILQGKASKDTPVSEIMTREVLVISTEKTLDDCMALMTARKIRHLPVMEDQKLAGIVSSGDVLKKIISEQGSAIRDLENYISGVDYGA